MKNYYGSAECLNNIKKKQEPPKTKQKEQQKTELEKALGLACTCPR